MKKPVVKIVRSDLSDLMWVEAQQKVDHFDVNLSHNHLIQGGLQLWNPENPWKSCIWFEASILQFWVLPRPSVCRIAPVSPTMQRPVSLDHRHRSPHLGQRLHGRLSGKHRETWPKESPSMFYILEIRTSNFINGCAMLCYVVLARSQLQGMTLWVSLSRWIPIDIIDHPAAISLMCPRAESSGQSVAHAQRRCLPWECPSRSTSDAVTLAARLIW